MLESELEQSEQELDKEKKMISDDIIGETCVQFELRHAPNMSLPSVLELLSSKQLETPFTWQNVKFAKKYYWREAYDTHQRELREQLWHQKTLLESIHDNTLYRTARDKIFPLSVSGKQSYYFSNRAGYKLLESMEATGIWEELSRYSVTRNTRSRHKHLTCSQNKNNNDNYNESITNNNIMSISTEMNNNEKSGMIMTVTENIHEKSTTTCKPQAKRRKRQRVSNNCLAFADICGGPGSFAEALLMMGKRHGLRWSGFGMTLANVEGLDWYNSLRRKRFVITYGVDGTGNIFNLANVEALVSLLHEWNVQLVVADGGFHVEPSLANYQETISARILFAQWLVAIKTLRRGGCFILKLFDTFAPLTRELLYLSTFLFRRVQIVKPKHSRVVNSERYLVCIDWQGHSNEIYTLPISSHELPSETFANLQREKKEEEKEEEEISWMTYLEHVYVNGFNDNEYIPELLPSEWITRDDVFMHDLTEMNSVIANNQITALKMVMKEVELFQSTKETNEESHSVKLSVCECDAKECNENINSDESASEEELLEEEEELEWEEQEYEQRETQ